MNTLTSQSPDDYRMPLTPEGAVNFTPDKTGEERVEFRASRLQRMTKEAIGLAEASKNADPEQSDTRRGEYGENVVNLLAKQATVEAPLDYTDPEVLLAQTARIRAFRTEAIEKSERAA
jgi:hypothetical protein